MSYNILYSVIIILYTTYNNNIRNIIMYFDVDNIQNLNASIVCALANIILQLSI